MLETASRPLTGNPSSLQPPRQVVGREPHCEALGHPVSHLGRRPGTLALAHLLADRLLHGGGERGALARMRPIGQGVKALRQKGFDIVAHALLVDRQMSGDPGNAPAGSGKPNHFQAIAGPRDQPWLVGAALQFFSLGVGETHAIHARIGAGCMVCSWKHLDAPRSPRCFVTRALGKNSVTQENDHETEPWRVTYSSGPAATAGVMQAKAAAEEALGEMPAGVLNGVYIMFLTNKRIVVIGGSSGIGLATAKMAAQQDAEVVIASRDAGQLDRAIAEIGGRTETYPLDVRDEARVKEFFEKLGSFDHLTTPGSSALGGPFLATETARARADFDSKFWGQYHAARYAAPNIRPGGSIVLFSGIYSQRPPAGVASVAAVNGAIEALGRALAVELAPLRVNVVSPGLTDTPAYNSMPPDQRQTMFKQVAESLPARRMGQPADIAQAVLYLMADPYATGTTLLIDGGFMLR
jgi:NAD(P)-dependent dehydrogenase (short-subunit alcohol dehydrogenase family)